MGIKKEKDMKVTYTFDLDDIEKNNDHFEILKFQNVNKMVAALSALDDFRRSIMKDNLEPTLDEVEDSIGEILIESGYYDIQ